MWSDACAQIFFTLSICIGVMISYASYSPKTAPIISNGFAVSLCNSGFSFFAGFAVFSTVGYLVGLNSPVATKVSSIGLAFIAYPAALETLPGSNFWCILLAITLFTLGIDSAFAMVEGTVTVIQDSMIGDKLMARFGSRMKVKVIIASALCIFGACGSTIFCSNWGFTYFDCVDHYLNVYLVLLMGILQSVAVGWFHCQEDAMKVDKVSSSILIISYFSAMVPLAWLAYFVFPDWSWTSIPAFWGFVMIMTLTSFLCANLGPNKVSFQVWYDEIFFSGVRPIAFHCMRVATTPMKPW